MSQLKTIYCYQSAEYLEISPHLPKQVGAPLDLEVIQELNTQPSEYTCWCHKLRLNMQMLNHRLISLIHRSERIPLAPEWYSFISMLRDISWRIIVTLLTTETNYQILSLMNSSKTMNVKMQSLEDNHSWRLIDLLPIS